MNMRQLRLPLIVLGMATGFAACKDDYKAQPANTQTIQALFQELKETPQAFTVSAGTSGQITGARGTVIRFNPQSFKDAGGNIITSGIINIRLTEAYTPGQMIMNGVTTTTAANKQLTSGGCVDIKATLNGQEVFANNYAISFKQPGPSENPMGLFKGYQTTDPGANIKWNDDITNIVERATKDTTSQSFFYAFDTCVNFNWVNCDYFYTAPDPKTDLKVVMPDSSYNALNTQVFVIFPTLNSVTNLYIYDAATRTFSFGYPGYYMPVGMSIKIMVVSGRNNAYYMDLQTGLTVTNNMTVTSNPASQTKTYIQAQLSAL